MGRWSQYDSDEHRLPEGLVRIAYDADTRVHTFRDTSSGKLYRSTPGNAYGTLYPVPDHLPSRPQAFAPEGGHHSRHRPRAAPETTFHDILPAHAITTSPPKGGSRSAKTLQRSQSTRVPSSSSHFNNSLHSRSKSVSNRTAQDRGQQGPYQHKRANTTTGTKSGFSLTSVFRSLSRSLTSARGRARQEKSTDDDRTREYRRL